MKKETFLQNWNFKFDSLGEAAGIRLGCAENYNISFGESVRTCRAQLEATGLLINTGVVVSRARGLRPQLLIVDKILDEIESG